MYRYMCTFPNPPQKHESRHFMKVLISKIQDLIYRVRWYILLNLYPSNFEEFKDDNTEIEWKRIFKTIRIYLFERR